MRGYGTDSLSVHKVINIDNEIIIKNIWISRIFRAWFAFLSFVTFKKIKYKRIDLKNAFELEIFPNASNYFLNGYPNNIGYFYKNINEILKKFNIKKLNDSKIRIGIHVREFDPTKHRAFNSEVVQGRPTYMATPTGDYYHRALEEVIKKNKLDLGNVEILIFCENPIWAKENIKIKGADLKFIIGGDDTAVEDFKKMSNCTHLIMPMSSYSWWAAAHIDNVLGGTIICPDLIKLKWGEVVGIYKFNIYPKGWKILDTEVVPKPPYLTPEGYGIPNLHKSNSI